MMNKSEFGKILKAKLEKNDGIVDLSRWAYSVFNENSRRIDPYLKSVMLDLARMEDAPEFEYSRAELDALAEKLMSETE